MDKQPGKIKDAVLVERIKQGDMDAMEEIVRRYSDRVYNLAFHLTRDASFAEEIMQNVFLTVVSKVSTLTNNAYFSTWLYRVALNASYGLLRKEKKHSNPNFAENIEMDEIATYDWSTLPGNILLSDESRGILKDAIDSLPESMRTVVIMKDVEGMKNEEIAQSMGLSVPAVKSRLHRGRLVLRGLLSEYFSRYEGQPA